MWVATGCTSEESSQPASVSTQAGDVTILQPGRPGDSAATVGPDAVPTASDWNHSDIAFMQMMVPHHAQALEMSALAESRTDNEDVRSLARRITGAQGPEILTMAAWLEERGIDVPRADEDARDYDHSTHGHDAMLGMLTEAQLERLRAARGERFDRLYLTFMIEHHRGAIDMADAVAVDGTDLRVGEIAADVAAGQSAEIQRMQTVLDQL